jgi:hypothetical protein
MANIYEIAVNKALIEFYTNEIRRTHSKLHRLNCLARIAELHHLKADYWLGHTRVGAHTSSKSLHFTTFPGTKIGCAFDGGAKGSKAHYRHATYANYVKNHLTPYITEGIFNGGKGKSLSVKNGKTVPVSYWGSDVWGKHKDHVHIAIRP